MAFGPAQVHPKQHLSPVLGFGPTGPGVDRQQCGAPIVWPAEPELEFEVVEPLSERLAVPGNLVRDRGLVFLYRQFEQTAQLFRLLVDLDPGCDLVAHGGELPHHCLRLLRISPELWRARPFFELV